MATTRYGNAEEIAGRLRGHTHQASVPNGAASGFIELNVDASFNIDSGEERKAQLSGYFVAGCCEYERFAHEPGIVDLNPVFKHMHVDS